RVHPPHEHGAGPGRPCGRAPSAAGAFARVARRARAHRVSEKVNDQSAAASPRDGTATFTGPPG
ncbi:hypothetical protein MXD58_005960, partial [Frankia sp. AgKG'84/4]|nr:hypothetical protein [Frankia sp. AgKG'84/4]